MKYPLILLLFTILFYESEAQRTQNNGVGKITGRAIDAATSQPIEYAAISLITQTGSKTVNGGTSALNGVFELSNIDTGSYKMLLYFIGYQTKELNNIVITEKNPIIQLGGIKLVSKNTALKEITITTEKSIIEDKIDKMVFNADQDITSQNGTAADVLKKVPQVSVDVDGNVELQGNANIRFLINGKPSVIFGNNIADVLQSLPASQIQSIEIITSPGAKYDAEGTGGIINIILKKSTAEGINGSVSLSAGTRLENGSLNLNAHHVHFSANAFLSGNALLASTVVNTMDRQSQDNISMQSAQLTQNGTSQFNRNGFESGLGFDWEITPKDNLTGSFGIDYFANNNNGINIRNSLIKDSLGNTISNVNDQAGTTGNSHFQTIDWGLNYKRKFKKEDQELEISYFSSAGNNYSYFMQTQQYVSPAFIYSGSYGNNPGTNKETRIAIDYVQPLAKDIMLETGVKTVISDINSTSDIYLLDILTNDYAYNSPQSSSLDYKTNVYAAYLSVKFKLFNWLDVKTGLRYEYTDPHAYFSNSGIVNIQQYGTYVPSGVVSHKFKNNQTVKLSYTHRIERPGYRDLNPFVNASDPKNINTGNTTLRPEIGDKIELGYSKIFEKGINVNGTLFYRGNKDDIQSYTRYYSAYKVGDSIYTNAAVSTRENIGRENNFGVNIFASIPFTSKINLRTNISGFQRYIINGALPGSNVQGFNYRINMNASYEISKTLVIEFFGNFNSPRINAQGTMPSFTTYNFAFRKQLFNKKASVAVTAANPFNKYVNQETKLTGENFTLDNMRQLPFRSFGINFTYKFGKLEFKKEKEAEDNNLTNPPVLGN